MFGTLKNWTVRAVMSVLCKDSIIKEVDRQFADKPGSGQFLGHFQTVLSQMMSSLTEADRESYEKKASEWNHEGVPSEMKIA